MILRDEQVGGAVVIAGNDGARIFQDDFVEADIGGDILKTVGTEIAKESYLTFALGSLTDSD